MANTIYICAHCGRAGAQVRSWRQKCKLHVIETDTDHVILKETGGSLKCLFYDPDIKRVNAEIIRRDKIAQEKKLKRAR